MTGGSGVVAVARSVLTAVVVLVAAVILGYCAVVAIWVSSTVGSPGVSTADVLWPAMGLGVVALVAVAAVLLQLRWANRARRARAVLLRSLLVLACPGAVVLVFALAA